MQSFKQKVYQYCLQLIADKIALLEATLHDLRESVANETKSTAGDKYETARAMIHIEQENTGRQLQEALAQKAQLEQLELDRDAARIIAGSLVKTNQGYVFTGPGLGKITVDGERVICVSLQAPLGMKLAGAIVNDQIIVNGIAYIIESIA